LPAVLAGLALVGGALWLGDAVSGRQALLYLIGAGLGSLVGGGTGRSIATGVGVLLGLLLASGRRSA
jgi:hypothetical protein